MDLEKWVLLKSSSLQTTPTGVTGRPDLMICTSAGLPQPCDASRLNPMERSRLLWKGEILSDSPVYMVDIRAVFLRLTGGGDPLTLV